MESNGSSYSMAPMLEMGWLAVINVDIMRFFDEHVIFGLVTDYYFCSDTCKMKVEFNYIWQRKSGETPWHRCWKWGF